MSKTIIIAEAGVNHNGSIELAKKLVDAAVEAGADYVKFQTFKADKIASKQAQKASYQKQSTDVSESQLDMLKRLELDENAHLELIAYCKEKNIAFLSTAFDFESIELLQKLGITLGKIPSGELTNLPFLRKMAKAFPEIILSTGMANMEEVKATINALFQAGTKQENLTILHCNTEYPTPFQDVNLKAMLTIEKELNVTIGYSDHTLGIEVPIAAVAMGAKVIEKHFTLDRNMEGPDHKASLEPSELKTMIASIRNIEMALSGNGDKLMSNSEQKNKEIARKSIVAGKKIEIGEVLTEDNMAVKRPGNGISPMLWDSVIGQKAPKDFEEDELIIL
jgi:N,N'-diacetyllegionaminate synthase